MLSHTERPWVSALALDDVYDAPEALLAELGPLVPRLTYQSADVTPMSDADLEDYVSTGVLQLMLRLLRDARTTSAPSATTSARASTLPTTLPSTSGPSACSSRRRLSRSSPADGLEGGWAPLPRRPVAQPEEQLESLVPRGIAHRDTRAYPALLVSDRRVELDEHDAVALDPHLKSSTQPCPSRAQLARQPAVTFIFVAATTSCNN